MLLYIFIEFPLSLSLSLSLSPNVTQSLVLDKICPLTFSSVGGREGRERRREDEGETERRVKVRERREGGGKMERRAGVG